MSKKEINNCHSEGDFNELEKQPTENVLQNDCSENVKKISRKMSAVVYYFWFY